MVMWLGNKTYRVLTVVNFLIWLIDKFTKFIQDSDHLHIRWIYFETTSCNKHQFHVA